MIFLNKPGYPGVAVLLSMLFCVVGCNASCTVNVKVRAFIPSPAVYVEWPLTKKIITTFAGDNRSFCKNCGTSRVGASTTFTINNDGTYNFKAAPGVQETAPSHRYDNEIAIHAKGKPSWWADIIAPPRCNTNNPLINALFKCSAQFKPTADNLYAVGERGTPTTGTVHLHIDAREPLTKKILDVLVPTIKLDLKIAFKINTGKGIVSWKIVSGGTHTGFPAFEVYVQNKAAYTYNPVSQKGSPGSLFKGLYFSSERAVGSGSFKCKISHPPPPKRKPHATSPLPKPTPKPTPAPPSLPGYANPAKCGTPGQYGPEWAGCLDTDCRALGCCIICESCGTSNSAGPNLGCTSPGCKICGYNVTGGFVGVSCPCPGTFG